LSVNGSFQFDPGNRGGAEEHVEDALVLWPRWHEPARRRASQDRKEVGVMPPHSTLMCGHSRIALAAMGDLD
jgi:hypothetical protein